METMETTEGPPWELEMEVRDHIQHCSCSCNHMGYGNFMDYQQTAIRELPDITELHCTQREYCNGGPPRPPPAPRLTPDSVSESSGTEPYRLGQRPRCVCLVLCVLAGAIAAGLGLPLALGGPGSRATQQQRLDIVKRLLQDVPLIDGHNDLPWNVRRFAHNRLAAVNLSGSVQLLEPWGKSPWSHTDIPRLRQGLLGAQFWSAYVPCGAQGLDAVQLALEQIDIIRRLVERHPRHLALATTTQGILDAHQNGRIASLIGVEGGHALGSSLAVLRALHALGARYLTITHSCDTSWAGSADSSLGLSVFGREIIREMNRIGMIVDLSHSSVQTSKDVLNSTYSPVIFSHSSSRALCNSTRNVPDDVLELVKDNDGLVMISFYSLLVACGRSSTSRDVIAHINHVRDVAGIEHVGLGAGYDGIDSTPSGLEDVSRYPHLLAELLEDSTWSEDDITKLAGGNLLRVFRAVEEVREQWRKAAVLPSEESEPPKRSDCAYMPS